MQSLRRKRQSKGEKTMPLTIRIPVALDERITILAIKSLISKSAWIIKALEQKAFRGVK